MYTLSIYHIKLSVGLIPCSVTKQFHNDSPGNSETNKGMRNIISGCFQLVMFGYLGEELQYYTMQVFIDSKFSCFLQLS